MNFSRSFTAIPSMPYYFLKVVFIGVSLSLGGFKDSVMKERSSSAWLRECTFLRITLGK